MKKLAGQGSFGHQTPGGVGMWTLNDLAPTVSAGIPFT
jgi:hypothetical protein